MKIAETLYVDLDPVENLILVYLAGLHEPIGDGSGEGELEDFGWTSLPSQDETNNWFGLTMDEAKRLHSLLGAQLYDAAVSEG